MDKEIYNSIFQEEIHDLIALKRALGLLAKVLSNPEMAVLLTSLAKSMQGEHN